MADESTAVKYNEILCIGLGLSGVCLSVQLKRKFGFTDIHLYDRNVSHSGTWCVNRYPGCACDVPAIFYSFSFEMNPNWTKLLPSNYEMQEYLEGIVQKYQLRPHMTFRTECESAIWDDKRQVWSVYLRDLETGSRYTHECRLLFSAVGVLVDGREPDINGWKSFKGPLFHTARWRSDVDLRNKDVVVVGNGCSASQTVPIIAPLTKTLTQFINTPHWVLPRDNIPFGPGTRWAFRNIPLLGRFVRMFLFLYGENHWRMYIMNKAGARMRRAYEKQSIDYTRSTAPKKYHDILIPDWELACKRRVFDADHAYFKTLHAPNVHLTKDPILEIVPQGVRTETKTYPADVIILATGFQTNNGLGPLQIQGRDGEWLNDHWQKMGGPGAYNSTAVHRFPNFMMIYGPNSTTGHSSVIFAIESMVNYALKIVEPIIRGEATTVEIKDDAERDYSRWLQAASSDKLWNTCHNWYVTNGWNSTMYPRSQIHFWYRSTFPTWSDWSYKYTAARSRRLRLRRSILLLLFIISIVGAVTTLNGSNRYRWSSFVAVASKLAQAGRKQIGI